MTDRVTVGNLRVAQVLYDFVNNEALPGTDIDPDTFWSGVDKVVADLTPKNQDLLARRDELQAQIDKWHRAPGHRAASTPRPTSSSSPTSATCSPNPATSPSPPRVSTTRSPPRRARSWWCRSSTPGSRSTPPTPAGARCMTRCTAPTSSPTTTAPRRARSYNKVRGDKVIAYARSFLDEAVPLASGSWADVTGLDRRRRAASPSTLDDGAARPGRARDSSSATPASRRARPVGAAGQQRPAHRDPDRPDSPVGSTDKAGIKDVVLESAITTIMDFEDSVAAVDADDKVLGYRNWLGLNRGDLVRRGHQGRQDVHPRAQRGPHLHRRPTARSSRCPAAA